LFKLIEKLFGEYHEPTDFSTPPPPRIAAGRCTLIGGLCCDDGVDFEFALFLVAASLAEVSMVLLFGETGKN
jgi:hypothetical protein